MIEQTKTVHKFPFSIKQPKFNCVLPVGFKFLDVTVLDEERPHFWIECAEGVERKQFNFQLFGTGQEIPMSATYMTTFTIGPFAFHLYLL